MSRPDHILTFLLTVGICVNSPIGKEAYAAQRPPADIVITDQEIADASSSDDSSGGDYFSLDSQQADVQRIQGEPDSKFFDGRYFIWYYGQDDVYFNFYGEVVGADNNSGKLKFK